MLNSPSWIDANQRYVLAAVSVVRATLEHHAGRFVARAEDRLPDRRQEAVARFDAAAEAMPAAPALERLVETFGLTPFERSLVLLGAGMETEADFGLLCAAAHNDSRQPYPTLQLALDALPGAHWDALAPDGPLRRWHMVQLDPDALLAKGPVRLAERVLHELLGVDHVDSRLAGVLESVHPSEAIAPSHQMLADRVTRIWQHAERVTAVPIVQLIGGVVSDRRAIAATVCQQLGRKLAAISASILPAAPSDLESLRRIWELEAALSGSVLILECEELSSHDVSRRDAVAWMAEHTLGCCFVSSEQRITSRQRPVVTIEIGPLPASEQRELWTAILDGHLEDEGDAVVQRLATQFHLGAPAIRAAGLAAVARRKSEQVALADLLWDACRTQARPQLDDLAEHIAPSATWDHLVLPAQQREMLRQIAVQVHQRWKVYEDWGFSNRGGRGAGVTVLFAGPSGTGKTMAAEVLADELDLDLYRVDLSSVVSKYIGETEKNLRKIFDAAETGGVILLFDEADALFGKRSEVKDSHDRHANVEVSYLLQRMEAYRGLAILTTNIKGALDVAFIRRLRFIVNFPFPDAAQREAIWRRIFPSRTPVRDLDFEGLSRLNAAGGLIRNMALTAAFLAADAGDPVTMKHLYQAARTEYAKKGRQLSPAELAGWTQHEARTGPVRA